MRFNSSIMLLKSPEFSMNHGIGMDYFIAMTMKVMNDLPKHKISKWIEG